MNASNSRRLALPKPRTVKKLRTRPRPMSAKRRKEVALVAKVFKEIRERDGECSLALYAEFFPELIGPCGGESQPAHLADWRRGTCKLPPEERSTKFTITRLCADHHRRYDQHEFDILYGNFGAEGYIQPMRRRKKGAA